MAVICFDEKCRVAWSAAGWVFGGVCEHIMEQLEKTSDLHQKLSIACIYTHLELPTLNTNEVSIFRRGIRELIGVIANSEPDSFGDPAFQEGYLARVQDLDQKLENYFWISDLPSL